MYTESSILTQQDLALERLDDFISGQTRVTSEEVAERMAANRAEVSSLIQDSEERVRIALQEACSPESRDR
jgi:hypothetical protein